MDAEQTQEERRRAESWATSSAVRRSMQSNKGRDTAPELRLRSAVHGRGLRYRVAARPLKGLRASADLLFVRARVAVFLDGCFWHGCPIHYTAPVANGSFWAEKVRRNRERDAETTTLLEEAGWGVIRIWEHEAPDGAADRIAQIVRGRTAREGVGSPVAHRWRTAASHLLPPGVGSTPGGPHRAFVAKPKALTRK